MEIGKLTLDEIRQIQQLTTARQIDVQRHPWIVGQCYFIRTVTMHLTGRLVDVTEQELVLEDAAWIADSGRFSEAMKTGTLDEVEPFPGGKLIVGRGAIVDAWAWPHTPPREVK